MRRIASPNGRAASKDKTRSSSSACKSTDFGHKTWRTSSDYHQKKFYNHFNHTSASKRKTSCWQDTIWPTKYSALHLVSSLRPQPHRLISNGEVRCVKNNVLRLFHNVNSHGHLPIEFASLQLRCQLQVITAGFHGGREPDFPLKGIRQLLNFGLLAQLRSNHIRSGQRYSSRSCHSCSHVAVVRERRGLTITPGRTNLCNKNQRAQPGSRNLAACL